MKLNKQQSTILTNLQEARQTYDARVSVLDEQYVYAKEHAKDPIRGLVQAATDAGVPNRQIHLALGYAQVNSLQSFLAPSTKLKAGLFTPPLGLENVGAVSGENLGAVFTTPEVPTSMFRQGEDGYAYWTEDGEEQRIRRTPLLGAPDYYDTNKAIFPTLSEATQEALKRDTILLVTKEELDNWTRDQELPERYDSWEQPHLLNG